MSKAYELSDAENFVHPQKGRMSPAERIVSELDGNFYTIRQAADIIGIHKQTVAKTLSSKKLKAPSKVLNVGRMSVYVLTEEDLIEVADFFEAKSKAVQELSDHYEGKIPKSVQAMIKDKP